MVYCYSSVYHCTIMQDVLLPLFYLPPVAWFSVFLEENNRVLLEQYENFPKQTYRNRANIYGANGKLSLIIPIRHEGKRTLKDLKISYAEDWQKLHWKSIKTAYQSSPFFEFYEEQLSRIFENKPAFLLDLNLKALEIIQEILKTNHPYTLTDGYIDKPEMLDFRNSFLAKDQTVLGLNAYYQVFSDRLGFLENLSVVDLICNKGPESVTYIKSLKI